MTETQKELKMQNTENSMATGMGGLYTLCLATVSAPIRVVSAYGETLHFLFQILRLGIGKANSSKLQKEPSQPIFDESLCKVKTH